MALCLVIYTLCVDCGVTARSDDKDGRVISSSVSVEPWFIATLVVLTSAALIFAVVIFTVCYCRRRDLQQRTKSTYRSAGLIHTTYVSSVYACQEVGLSKSK